MILFNYFRDVFDHIIERFELPDPQNRWDSPFFTVLPGEELDLSGIYSSLFSNLKSCTQTTHVHTECKIL